MSAPTTRSLSFSRLVSGDSYVACCSDIDKGLVQSNSHSHISNSINFFYVLIKGAASFKLEEKLGGGILALISFATGAVFGLIWIFFFGPWAKKQIAVKMAKEAAAAEKKVDVEAAAPTATAALNEEEDFDSFQKFIGKEGTVPEAVTAQAVASPEPVATEEISKSWYQKLNDNTVDQDLHSQLMHESSKAKSMWDNKEQFDEGAENLFHYIQVFTASMNSFAHGANDVANTIAPMSAVIDIYMTGEVGSKTGIPKWMLAYGGFAIVMGLLLYGYKVMKLLGYKLTMLSPSRGTSAELGVSLTSVTASFLGIPISTTQCIVGAVTAVSLVSGHQAVDLWFLLKICASWVGLFFIAVIFFAGFFSFCYYSPGKIYPAYQIDIVEEE